MGVGRGCRHVAQTPRRVTHRGRGCALQHGLGAQAGALLAQMEGSPPRPAPAPRRRGLALCWMRIVPWLGILLDGGDAGAADRARYAPVSERSNGPRHATLIADTRVLNAHSAAQRRRGAWPANGGCSITGLKRCSRHGTWPAPADHDPACPGAPAGFLSARRRGARGQRRRRAVRPELRARAFERFGRAQSVRDQRGAGLGLAIADAHGGRATILPGRPMTVRIRLPNL